jgi:transposase
MDTAAEKIQVAMFRGEEAKPSEEFEISTDARGIGRLKAKLGKEAGVVKCVYEAGPCGYELQRTLTASGYECEVIAPSLTPRKPGERVKTNRLDARRLGTYHRGRQLTPVRIPDEKQEALRDLLRSRDDARRDVMRGRQRLNALLLGTAWTRKHWAWVKAIEMREGIVQEVLEEHITTVEAREAGLARLDSKIEETAKEPEYAKKAAAYGVLRGIKTLSAMTILAEGGDLRQYAGASEFMGSTGMVPSENSTGNRQRQGSITKSGNVYLRRILIESAQAYRLRANGGASIRQRRKDQPEALLAIARKADHRLHGKYSKMVFRHNKRPTVAIVAVARELAGFVWAIGQIVESAG